MNTTDIKGAVYSVDSGFVPLRSANNRMTMIASGSADTSVIIWNLRSGNRYETFDASTDAIYAVRFSPDGEFVAAGGRDGKVRLYNLRKRALTHEFYGCFGRPNRCEPIAKLLFNLSDIASQS